MGSDGDPPAAAPGQQQHQNDDAADKKSKIRAFKNASSHGEGCTGAAWIQIEEGGKTVWRALTTGSDGKLVLRDGSDESLSVIKISGDHEKASPCVAVAGDGKTVASVEGCYVQLYSAPDLDLLTSACRFTLPGRCAAFGGKGLLAAAGDDGLVKLCRIAPGTGESKIVRQISTGGFVRSVAVDPEGAYVAATLADGTLGVWDAATGQQEAKRAVGSKVDPESTRRCAVAWSPDGGTLLAVAGRDNDAVLLERLSWKPAVYLADAHTDAVNAIAFSPNGVYVATGGLDGRVVVWLAERGAAVAQTTLDEVPSSLAWHPKGDALLIAGEGGSVGLWAGAVPAGLPSAWRAPDEVLREADAAAAGAASTAAGTTLDDGGEDSLAAPRGGAGGRRLKRRAAASGVSSGGAGLIDAEAADAGDDEEEDNGDGLEDDDEDGAGAGFKRRRKAAAVPGGGGGLLRPGAAATALMAPPAPRLPKPQAPIQPGATPEAPEGAPGAGARFLAYNAVGCVVSRRADGHRTVEVAFHDAAARGGRAKLPLLADYYGFDVAALGEEGVLYGSPKTADAPPMLMYRPFDFWAANADWSAQLPADERPLCLAAGRGFVAAATSAHQLRLYSAAGRQLAVLALPGAPVALAAAGPLLLAAHHAADPAWAADAAGGQRLAFALYDASRQALLASGPLPLGRGAGLAWLGLSDEGLPAAYDTAGVMRLRSADWGGAWVPVFDAKAARSEGASAEAFWPVGVSTRELTCVVTSEAKPHPAVHPRPVLAVRPLRAGGAPADGAPADLEDDALRHALRLGALRAAAADADDADEAQRRADDVEAALLEADRGALRQFNAALSARREGRALELVGALHGARSVQGALQLANARRHAALAERISVFLEERLAWEAARAAEQEEEAAAAAGVAAEAPWRGASQQRAAAAADGGADDGDGDVAMADDEAPAPAPAPTGSGGGSRDERAPAPDQQQRGAKVAGIFARASSGGSGGSAAAKKAAAAAKAPPAVASSAAARPAGGGGGGNPFARAKKPAK